MGTGVGEAMLLGAAMGGGSAAITGGDPLKGALIGGLTGGAGAGIAPALGAVAPEATTTLAGSALTATPTATQVGTQLGVQGAATGVGSQSAMLADQIAGFGPQGIASLQGAAQAAIPAGTLPSTAVTAVGAPVAQTAIPATGGTFGEGMAKFAGNPMASLKANPFTAAGAGLAGAIGGREEMESPGEYDGPLKRFKFNPDSYQPSFFAAEGGIATLASGGYDRMVGEQPMYPSNMARGGISDLGSYSDYARGGRMLKGPGDGMSDSIPASIAGKRPARLATEEFVVPADVVSHLGNGSSDAGAKQLYAMMDRVRKARTGRKSQGREISPQQYMAA
jgi:hypothetical protein